MARKDVVFSLSQDFRTIRIQCGHDGCQISIDLAPEQVEGMMSKTRCCCPICGKPFTDPSISGGADVITQFIKSVMALQKLGGNVIVSLPFTKDFPD